MIVKDGVKLVTSLSLIFLVMAFISGCAVNQKKLSQQADQKPVKAGGILDLQTQQELLASSIKLWNEHKPTHYRYRLLVECDCRYKTLHNPRNIKSSPAIAFEYDRWLIIEIQDNKIISVIKEDGKLFREYIAAISQQYPSEFSDNWTSSPNPINFGFEVIQHAVKRSAEVLSVVYDGKYGYPSEIKVDGNKAAADDEFYMKVEHFEILD